MEQPMPNADTSSKQLIEQFTKIEDTFNAAMISNDVAEIAECITDDWCLVTPERGPIGRADILGVIERGVLTHDSMTKDVVRVKVYGDVALVTGRGRNTGTFRGAPISADEWVTDVYRLEAGRWRCVLTHLTPAQ
jgi:ketosteroid isomerase-like protein